MVESWRLRSATLACNLVKSQRYVTNIVWVVLQSEDSVMSVTVSAATAEQSLEVQVAKITKASSMSC